MDWYEICQLRQRGRTAELRAKLAEFEAFLRREKPRYWRRSVQTIRKTQEGERSARTTSQWLRVTFDTNGKER